MDGRNHLLAYVELCGGRPEASKRLGIPYPTLAAICNGTRGVSRDMAERLAKRSSGMLDADKLVWIKAEAA